jgi:hypothetical protein
MRIEELARKWLTTAGLVLLVAGLAVIIGGSLLPEQHEVVRTLTLSRTPEAVWRAISDSVRIRAWRRPHPARAPAGFGVACRVAGNR